MLSENSRVFFYLKFILSNSKGCHIKKNHGNKYVIDFYINILFLLLFNAFYYDWTTSELYKYI
jgi:hypothetical protein